MERPPSERLLGAPARGAHASRFSGLRHAGRGWRKIAAPDGGNGCICWAWKTERACACERVRARACVFGFGLREHAARARAYRELLPSKLARSVLPRAPARRARLAFSLRAFARLVRINECMSVQRRAHPTSDARVRECICGCMQACACTCVCVWFRFARACRSRACMSRALPSKLAGSVLPRALARRAR